MATSIPTSEKKRGSRISAGAPFKWWQWLLVYPTFGVALIGAIPTAKDLIHSFKFDVPIAEVDDSKKQHAAFVRNLSCLEKSAAYSKVVLDMNITSKFCDSGDIFLQAYRPGWKTPQTRWVTWSEIVPTSEMSPPISFTFPSLIPEAAAAAIDGVQLAQYGPVGQTRVLCQRFIGNGLLLQRLQAQNGCFNQVINTYSGWITSIHQVPCHSQC